MKRTRSKTLNSLVITKNDLKNIWGFLERTAVVDSKIPETENSASSNLYRSDPPRPTITVISENSLTTETDDDGIFDNDVLDLQKSLSIDFSYSNYRTGKKLLIALKEGETSWSPSSFSVSGDDPGWVDAAFTELERIFGAVKPQSNMFNRFRWVITVLLATAVGFSFYEVVALLPPSDSHPNIPAWLVYVKLHVFLKYSLFVVFDCLWGLMPAWYVVNWVGRLWPPIEFDFGPEHLKQRKRLRKRLGAIIALFLLPFAIEAFERFVLGWH